MIESFSGFFVVNKPVGISTFDIIRIIKKKTGLKKLGHSGTLDPFAQGLVVILVGKMTKLFDYFSTLPKTYIATAELGRTTDTLDVTGTFTSDNETQAGLPSFKTLSDACKEFTGIIKQRPPIYSAVHVDGKRAYQLAREGLTPVLQEKEKTIYSIEILNYENNFFRFETTCSSGTYIRVLAADIAEKCGTKAYLQKLERTSIGGFSLENAFSPEDITESALIAPKEGFPLIGLPPYNEEEEISLKTFLKSCFPEKSEEKSF